MGLCGGSRRCRGIIIVRRCCLVIVVIGRFQDFSDSCIGSTLGLKAVCAANQEAFGVRLSQYTYVVLTLILQKVKKKKIIDEN